MRTQSVSVTQTKSARTGTLVLPVGTANTKIASELSKVYQIEEHEPVATPVPLGSPLAIATHVVTWACWALYFAARLPTDRQSATWWFWLIYVCEAAFLLPDFQTALELSFSLFGPRKFFQYTQYSLKGTRAPTVSVLITVCGEDIATIMDTVAAAAVQQYPHDKFQVFVLDDAADAELQTAVGDFNAASHECKSGYKDVVYYARQKLPNQRHYYKSGNLRAGIDLTASEYGASEYFAALDADMISAPDWLARTVPHLIKDEDLALVSPPQISYNILADDQLCQDSNVYAQILEPFRDFLGSSQCSGSGYIMRRHALDSIGGWPLANIGEDIVCSNMLLEHGWKTRYIPDQLQFGLAPDSFHSYINQRIRWTYGSLLVERRFGFFLRGIAQGNKLTTIQRILSIMGALKAYAATLAFAAVVCLPACFWALQSGRVEPIIGREHLRLIIMCHFIASMTSKKLVYGRLGSMNVSNMTTSKLWSSPFNAFCTVKSLFSDPGETSFKVSGTFASPTDERYAARRKPLLDRMLNLMMISYAAFFLLVIVTLASFATFVAHQHLIVNTARSYMHTGAALRLLDIILAALVPLRYMVYPPSLPDRRELLVKDEHGVYRSKKKHWTKRDGDSKVKLLLQIAIIGLFDWL